MALLAVGQMTESPHARLVACALLTLSCACSDDAVGPAAIDDTPGEVAWLAVDAGLVGSCAIADGGAAYCWGRSLLPACAGAACATPTRVPGMVASFRSVETASQFVCGVTDAGDVYCWGKVYVGSLGDGTTLVSETQVRVAIPEPVVVVTVSFEHACALTGEGVAYCWGGIGNKLGLGGGADRAAAPQPVATSLRFRSISAGTTQTCAVTAGDEGFCWGGGYGSLGVGAADTSCAYSDACLDTPAHMAVAGSHQWISIDAGNGFTCGVTLDHRGYCWGAIKNRDDVTLPFGVLGTGDVSGSKTPQPVAGALQFQEIATGTRHACGVTLDGGAYCWGSNHSGELGVGFQGGSASTPQPVVGRLRFSALSAGEHTCAVSVNRNVFCWGIAAGGGLGGGTIAPGSQAFPARILLPGP